MVGWSLLGSCPYVEMNLTQFSFPCSHSSCLNLRILSWKPHFVFWTKSSFIISYFAWMTKRNSGLFPLSHSLPTFKQPCDLTGKCMLSLGIGVHKSLSLSRGNQQIASELASLFICIEFSLFISLWLIFITSHSTEPDFMLSLQVQFNWSHEGSKILLRRRYGFMQWYKL